MSDIGGKLHERLILMLATSCCMTVGAILGAVVAGHLWFTLGLIAAGAFATAWVADLHRPLEVVCRFATVGMAIGSGAGVHDPGAAAAFLSGGLFACVVVLVAICCAGRRTRRPCPPGVTGSGCCCPPSAEP